MIKIRHYLVNYRNPKSLGSRIRSKRLLELKAIIEKIVESEKIDHINICDIGGTVNYWRFFMFNRDINYSIDIININPEKEDTSCFPSNVRFYVKKGDGRLLENIKDKQYHLAHSNSVIEHVGGWLDVRSFSEEIVRIAKYYYIQTPNFWFPIEPHFLVPFYSYLPKPIRIWILYKLKIYENLEKAILADEGINLLTRKQLQLLFKDSIVFKERFFFLTKSHIITNVRYSR